MNFPNSPVSVILRFELDKVAPSACTVPMTFFQSRDDSLRGRSNLFRIMGCPFLVTASSSFPERTDFSSTGVIGRDARTLVNAWLRMTAEDRLEDMRLFRDSNPTLHAAAMAIYHNLVQRTTSPLMEDVTAILLRESEEGVEMARGVTIGDVVTLRGLRRTGLGVTATCGGFSVPEECFPADVMQWFNDRTGRIVVRGLQPSWQRDGVITMAHFGGQVELVLGDYPGIGSVYNYATTEMSYSAGDLGTTATLSIGMRAGRSSYAVNPQRGWISENERADSEERIRQNMEMLRSGVISQADALRLSTGEPAPQVPPAELFQPYTNLRAREGALADQLFPQAFLTVATPPLEAQAEAQRRAQRAYFGVIAAATSAEGWARATTQAYQQGLMGSAAAIGRGMVASDVLMARPPSPSPLSEADRRLAERVLGRPVAPEEPKRHSEIGRPAGRGVFIDHE